jgi:uncharacterized protein involved in response to NO
MAVGVCALMMWVVTPSGRLVAAALGIAGLLHVVRLARWAGYRTVPDRLVLILHVAYAFVPAGFLLAALSAAEVVAPSAGIHAWTGGAIGSMTIAVMTRASLGHTGQELSASIATQLVYASIVIAALARVCAALEPAHSFLLLMIAGLAWSGAFLGFALAYGPLLCRARKF